MRLCTYFNLVTETIAFVGSHLDVVPANPENWERNPFKLVVEVFKYNMFPTQSNVFNLCTG